MKRERTEYFDCLRIAATVAVIILHISALKWYSTDVKTYEWHVLNVYDSMMRWCVPVFVMISGALFLGGDQSILKIYKKNILRIITAFVFWSFIYAFIDFLEGASIKEAILMFIQGHYHLWFLFMIVGLYIIVPFLRKIVETRELTQYFLIIALIFSFVFPALIVLINWGSKSLGEVANNILADINFHFTVGYVFYFVCGYYINKIKFTKNKMLLFIF